MRVFPEAEVDELVILGEDSKLTVSQKKTRYVLSFSNFTNIRVWNACRTVRMKTTIRPGLRSVWPVDTVLEEELVILTVPTIPITIPKDNRMRNKSMLRTNAHIPSGFPKKSNLTIKLENMT